LLFDVIETNASLQRTILHGMFSHHKYRIAGSLRMKIKTGIALGLVSITLASCVSAPPQRSMAPAAPQRPAVDGRWVDRNGIVSTFQNGTFSTHSTDSNTLLASGNYSMISPTLIEINMTSLLRNTQSKVNCAMVSQSQLNCTTDSNNQFSLSRQG
jgi:hypothetical protein